MPIRRSIRDIQTSNTISDMVSIDTIKKQKTKKINKVEKAEEIEKDNIEYNIEHNIKNDVEQKNTENINIIERDIEKKYIVDDKIENNNISKNISNRISNRKKINLNKILNILSQIKPIYLISFVVIILGLIVLFLVPVNKTKDAVEEAKKESELVKKHFSKLMILPENDQIDIRKITNKIEDPFFKNAEIGDYLIIFYKNRIAYIYSMKKNIIINSGVVFIDPKTATTSPNTKIQ